MHMYQDLFDKIWLW